jgi:hypothetical protein
MAFVALEGAHHVIPVASSLETVWVVLFQFLSVQKTLVKI